MSEQEEPMVDIYLQWIYASGIPLSQAKVEAEWLNKYMQNPNFRYTVEEQIGPDREQIFAPTEVVEGEDLSPFYPVAEREPLSDEEQELFDNWYARKPEEAPTSAKLIWPPSDEYDAEALYNQTFVSLNELAEEDQETYTQFLENMEDF